MVICIWSAGFIGNIQTEEISLTNTQQRLLRGPFSIVKKESVLFPQQRLYHVQIKRQEKGTDPLIVALIVPGRLAEANINNHLKAASEPFRTYTSC